jgi:hypothetical protein
MKSERISFLRMIWSLAMEAIDYRGNCGRWQRFGPAKHTTLPTRDVRRIMWAAMELVR